MDGVTYYESYATGDGKYFYPMMYINSEDTKPTAKVAYGSKITETDTGWVSIYDKTLGWNPLFCLKEEE